MCGSKKKEEDEGEKGMRRSSLEEKNRNMQEHLSCTVEKLAERTAETEGGILARMDRKEKELITRVDEFKRKLSRNVHENEEDVKRMKRELDEMRFPAGSVSGGSTGSTGPGGSGEVTVVERGGGRARYHRVLGMGASGFSFPESFENKGGGLGPSPGNSLHEGVQSVVSTLKSRLLDHTLEHVDWDQVATHQNRWVKKMLVC